MRPEHPLRALLREPAFLRVWGVGVFSGIARWLEMLVAGIFAFEVTGSPFLVALLVILRMLPLVVFGSVLGTFADRLSPRLLLLGSLAFATLTSTVMLLLFVIGVAVYWHVALATLASGLIWTADMPLRRRILGDAAGLARIAPAMSLDSASSNATRMLGPLIGGILYQGLGMAGAFALTALLYGVSLLLLLGVPAAVSAVARGGAPTRILADFQEAFRYAARDGDVLRILAVTVVFNVWGFPFVSMIPVIGEEELGLDAGWIGLLAALEGGGAFLGALAIAVWVRTGFLRPVYYFGTLGFLVFVFAAGWTGAALPMGLLLFCVGLGGACFTAMQSTLIYSVAPSEMRGRLFGLLTICIGSGLLGFANVGLMGEWFGGAAAIRIVAAEGVVPLLLIGLGWRQLWGGGSERSND